jgi:hypothetical protein
MAVSSWITGRGIAVGRVDGLLVADQRQPEDGVPLRAMRVSREDLQVDPQVVGVEVGVPVLVGEEVHLLRRGLRGVAQDELAVRLADARWPPLRSLAVRGHTSAAYGAPDWANQPASVALGAAPRLSPLASTRSGSPLQQLVEQPEPSSAGRCRRGPGGHHSSVGVRRPVDGLEGLGVSLGSALDEVERQTPTASSS